MDTPWYRSWTAIGAGLLLVPPLGWLLLAIKPGVRWWAKALAIVPALLLAVAQLYFVWGFRPMMTGSGEIAVVRQDLEEHYERIEEDRSAKQQVTPGVVEAAQEAPASAVSADAEAAANAEAEPAGAMGDVKPSSAVWSDYRGPARDGRYGEVDILTSWPDTGLEEVWRKPIGGGYASMVVADGKVFTIEQRRDQEVVAAYDLKTGNQIWQTGWKGYFRESLGGDGPRATPTWHEGNLYALGAEGELRALDAQTGNVLWSKNILKDAGAENLTWGMAASPLVVEEKLVVLPGGSTGKSVVAYHKDTGEKIWSSLNDRASYASPQLATLAGKRQVLLFTANRFVGIDPQDGKLLWEFPWPTSYDINSAQPLVLEGDRVFISSGYDHGAAMLRIKKSDGGFAVEELWQNRNMKNKFNSSVEYNGYIYGLDDGILACVDAATGERKWKGGRYGFGQLLLANGHLIVTTEQGEVVLVKASPEKLVEVARFPALDGKTWNVPALAQGYLLVRNQTEMVAYRIAKS